MKNPFLSKDQLEKLSTQRLLAYKRSKRFYLYKANVCSCGSPGCDGDTYLSRNPEMKPFIEQLEDDLREVLSKREHVKRKKK